MANGYSRRFTLTDLLNNPKLANKLPLVNYKEKITDDGKVQSRTNMQTLETLVYNTSKASAKPFYKPFKPTRNGSIMVMSGKLVDDNLDGAFNAVYNALVSQRNVMSLTVNNGDMLRSALKEAQKVKSETGKEPKLYLKVGSMKQIENMKGLQLSQLVDDIMRNIFYNDEYSRTQRKYDVKSIPVNKSTNYEKRKLNWQLKVGIL